MAENTQKQLILLRHAKAVEDDAGGDHARPLNARGLADAEAVGAWLVQNDLLPDVVLCSTATRTRQTLDALGSTLPTLLRDKLYLATAGELLAHIQSCDDAARRVMVIAHNPGLHVLLARLVRDYAHESDAEQLIMKFPTAACAVLSLDVTRWADVTLPCATLEQLRWPGDL